MQRDARAFLWDACEAADAIMAFTQGRSLDDYLNDRLLRSAVERQFEILGEALHQLSRHAPETARSIPELSDVVGFRNILVHGYAVIDHPTVWRTVQQDLPDLRQRLQSLWDDFDGRA